MPFLTKKGYAREPRVKSRDFLFNITLSKQQIILMYKLTIKH